MLLIRIWFFADATDAAMRHIVDCNAFSCVAEYKPREFIGTPELLSDPGHEAATNIHPLREQTNRDCIAMG